MGLVNPTRANTSLTEGAGEVAEANAVTTLLAEFNGNVDDANLKGTVKDKIGLSDGTTTRRGKSIIATTESRTNVAYGTMPTPDQVTVTLPTDGLLVVAYEATWQESVSNAARAAIFVGANQLRIGAVTETSVGQSGPGSGLANLDTALSSGPQGLVSSGAGAYAGDATTGQPVVNGIAHIFAAAGTYAVSIQFKASSGSVTAKNRKLWVWTLGF